MSTDALGVTVNDARENENEAVSVVERSVAGEEKEKRKTVEGVSGKQTGEIRDT